MCASDDIPATSTATYRRRLQAAERDVTRAAAELAVLRVQMAASQAALEAACNRAAEMRGRLLRAELAEKPAETKAPEAPDLSAECAPPSTSDSNPETFSTSPARGNGSTFFR